VTVKTRADCTIVEAYPVDEAAPSYRLMGFVAQFAAAGFREVGRAGTRRHVVRLPVRKPHRSRHRAPAPVTRN
jgi:hypothetical protein